MNIDIQYRPGNSAARISFGPGEELTAEGGEAEIGIAHFSFRDMKHVYPENDTIYLRGSAFVASGMGIQVESKWQGLIKGFFSGEGWVCRFRSQGKAWIQTREVPAWISWVNPFRPAKNN